jgi:hypothetical protein
MAKTDFNHARTAGKNRITIEITQSRRDLPQESAPQTTPVERSAST